MIFVKEPPIPEASDLKERLTEDGEILILVTKRQEAINQRTEIYDDIPHLTGIY